MTKKKVVKNIIKKSNSKKIKLENKINQQKIEPGSYDYYQMKVDHLIYNAWSNGTLSESQLDKIEEILKNKSNQTQIIDGYIPEVKTRTFTSTTFDDIISFPKYPVNKQGFHIESNPIVDNNDKEIFDIQLKTFVKNDSKYTNKQNFNNILLSMLNSKDIISGEKILNEIINNTDFIENWKDIAKCKFNKKYGPQPQTYDEIKRKENEEFQAILDEDDRKLREELDVLTTNKKLPQGSLNEIEENVQKLNNLNVTNREKINKSNELFKNLASYVGEITKEYWTAKQKLVLINKFMEDFYSGKEFEFVKNNPILGLRESIEQNIEENLNGNLNKNKYAQDILNAVRGKKYSK